MRGINPRNSVPPNLPDNIAIKFQMKRIVSIDVRMLRSSGIGVVISNIIPRLIAWRPDWDFRLLGDSSMLNAYAWSRAGNVSQIPFTAPIHSMAEQWLWPAAAVAGSDIVLSPNYNIPLRWEGHLAVIVHDVAHLALPKIFNGVRKQVYANFMFEQVRRRATGICFVSEFTKNEFGHYVGEPRGRVSIVYPGVDAAWYSARRSYAPSPSIIYVGNIKPHKNVRGLVDAFEKIYREIPHVLRLVGRREGFLTGDPAIEDRIRHFGGRIQFTGILSDEALRQAVADADALVLPSFYEGFGIPPLEAMAVGCPVLVSAAASLPEVCGDAALYCDPQVPSDIASALKRIVADNGLRERLRASGRARAQMFSWDTAAEKYLSSLDEILNGDVKI